MAIADDEPQRSRVAAVVSMCWPGKEAPPVVVPRGLRRPRGSVSSTTRRRPRRRRRPARSGRRTSGGCWPGPNGQFHGPGGGTMNIVEICVLGAREARSLVFQRRTSKPLDSQWSTKANVKHPSLCTNALIGSVLTTTRFPHDEKPPSLFALVGHLIQSFVF